jgi:tetratricopeptide (TPR) repeat protein
MKSYRFGIVIVGFLVLMCVTGCKSTNPLEAVRLNRQAQVYYREGFIDQATTLLQQSVDHDYENPASHYWLGQCYEQKNNAEKAIFEYEIAVRFSPSMELAQLALISALHRQGRIDESVQATKVFCKNKYGLACDIITIADDFAAKGMDNQAVLVFNRAQEVEPDNAAPSVALADFYKSKGQIEMEKNIVTKAVVIDPGYPNLMRRAGELGLRVDVPEPPLIKPPPRYMYDLP